MFCAEFQEEKALITSQRLQFGSARALAMLQHADSKEAAELCMPSDADLTYDARGGATGFTDSEGSVHKFDQAGTAAANNVICWLAGC